jgi:site-specific DNA-methyltransferase (adenine-specific)
MREFLLMDNIDLMKKYPDKYFSLAIIDPPYGIGAHRELTGFAKGWNVGHDDKEWDDTPPPPEYWKELFRVSKNQIVFGANYFIEHLGNTRGMVAWRKENGESFFADFELIWVSHGTVNREFTYHSATRTKHDGKRIHPTQKPVALYRFLLKKFAKTGDIILDTHVGSGSSLIAFEESGFDYVACELDPDYFVKAVERLEIYRSQGKLDFSEVIDENK